MIDLCPYFFAFIIAFAATAISMGPLRAALSKYLKDTPSGLKNHQGIIPIVGGCAVALGFYASLIIIRLATTFPSGTLRNLRGIFYGGFIIFTLGLIDDLRKPKGLTPYIKLFFQAIAAIILIHYDIYIQFLPNPWGYILTVLWVIGVTNAFNLIDIMDGLAISQAALAALAFGLIAMPSEFIYVNFAALALAGAAFGFWPYNHSKKYKTFLGDSGSLLLGFLLSALALGTNYTTINPLGVFCAILILALPLFDTAFVSIARLSKGISPLTGTADHFPLRLVRLGLKKKTILLLSILVAVVWDALAFWITKTTTITALIIYTFTLLTLILFAVFLKYKTE
ncbi:MAG: undecaprenyl/decaprenyl-phosphate alpha-N-acetylglucosaminyl 1-phosphate transferase [Elusimicrobiota bacterium]|jgi:UDP-GlcNAc:undecaprenyl-phosphate GlcNAc-1-phosphate transferase|nr:undecaprenyl/decaprenyl-phosphate alpha-N-acetylglucosaminyl 1-phosphate transferase [Elusimicrobiota bacterium]